MLWLEQLSAAGKAYEERASALSGQLSSDLERAERRLVTAKKSGSLPDFVGILAKDGRLPRVKTHSLPLAGLGAASPDAIAAADSELARCRQEPSRTNLDASLAALETARLPTPLEEANFLAICRRLHMPETWPSGQPLHDVLVARQTGRGACSRRPGSAAGRRTSATGWVRRNWRGQIGATGPGRCGAARPERQNSLTQADDTVASLKNLTIGQRAAHAFEQRDELWAQSAVPGEWLCRPQFDADKQEAADTAIRQTLMPLLAAGIDLDQHLASTETQEALPTVRGRPIPP